MSTLPQIFKEMKSAILKPTKQGAIFNLKLQPKAETTSILQPEQFYSVYSKQSQSRLGTSHSLRSKKVVSFTANSNCNTRDINSSQSQRQRSRICSRQSTREIRKDIYSNYGSTQNAFSINQKQNATQQADSLIHGVGQALQSVKIAQILLVNSKDMVQEVSKQVKELNQKVNKELDDFQKQVLKQVEALKCKLSTMRRSTGMFMKMNKNQAIDVAKQFESIGSVLKNIDIASFAMQSECLK